jgi:hypothetical protein
VYQCGLGPRGAGCLSIWSISAKNRYEIRFLFEIPENVVAKRPVVRGKRSAVALQKAQNRTGLTLGQHPNRGKRVELNAGGSNEFIGGFEVFRFMHGVVVSDFNSYPIRS